MKPCMTPEEYAGWERWNNTVTTSVASPCFDCTIEFHEAMKAQGRCDSQPLELGRPRAPYDPLRERRRQQWREASQRRRDAQKAAA